mgnify:CR=1 FL=1
MDNENYDPFFTFKRKEEKVMLTVAQLLERKEYILSLLRSRPGEANALRDIRQWINDADKALKGGGHDLELCESPKSH